MGDKWAWVFNASDVQQVMLNAVLLTPTPFFPGTAPFPAMTPCLCGCRMNQIGKLIQLKNKPPPTRLFFRSISCAIGPAHTCMQTKPCFLVIRKLACVHTQVLSTSVTTTE